MSRLAGMDDPKVLNENPETRRMLWHFPAVALFLSVCLILVSEIQSMVPRQGQRAPQQGSLQASPAGQSQTEVDRKNAGCVSCHTSTDEPTMHPTGTVRLACIDCHGGDSTVSLASGVAPSSDEYQQAKRKAHPKSALPEFSRSSANPVRAYTQWLKENYDYIRFINPGDLRVADQTCGQAGCHVSEVWRVKTSMMTTGDFLWGAALYNNGAFPVKNARFGESYSADGVPQALHTVPPPTPDETRSKGVLAELTPLQRWEISQPGNVLRVFERGGQKKAEIGNPDREEESGRPDDKLGFRGFGTDLRTDPVFLGLQKTRLLDPLMYLPGTNDHPGDYRASGCSSCHVVYANDRSPDHSGPYAKYGNLGQTATSDPTIPKNESGHPIRHTFTRAIPSSTCMVCHVHPGTNMVTTYFGYTWWDNEADGEFMYPSKQRHPTEEERYQSAQSNPEPAAVHGFWSDPKFLAQVGSPEFNKQLKQTQFADFHSHGWIFRAVFERDRKGNLLDADGKMVSAEDPNKFEKAVHLKDIHAEKGMQCIDCHFEQETLRRAARGYRARLH
jgi:hypothetical protein